jgi:hypothetical protein
MMTEEQMAKMTDTQIDQEVGRLTVKAHGLLAVDEGTVRELLEQAQELALFAVRRRKELWGSI